MNDQESLSAPASGSRRTCGSGKRRGSCECAVRAEVAVLEGELCLLQDRAIVLRGSQNLAMAFEYRCVRDKEREVKRRLAAARAATGANAGTEGPTAARETQPKDH